MWSPIKCSFVLRKERLTSNKQCPSRVRNFHVNLSIPVPCQMRWGYIWLPYESIGCAWEGDKRPEAGQELTNRQADSNVSTRIAIATWRHALLIAELTASNRGGHRSYASTGLWYCKGVTGQYRGRLSHRHCRLLRLCSIANRRTSMEHWWKDTDRGRPNCWEKNLPQ